MTRVIDYRVRPSSRHDASDILKIFLSPANFLTMKNGDICNIEDSRGIVGPAIAWCAIEKIKDDVVQTSKALQQMYGLKLDSRISISRCNQSVEDAFDMTLFEIPLDGLKTRLSCLDQDERLGWTWLLRKRLQRAGLLTPGMTLDMEAEGTRKSFQIQHINSSDNKVLYSAHSTCKVRIVDTMRNDGGYHHLFASSEGVGGLTSQFQEINTIIETYVEPVDKRCRMHSAYRPFEGGFVLYGPEGTGKSLVLRQIAAAGWREVFHIDDTIIDQRLEDCRATLTGIFSAALSSQPSVIIIDRLDFVAGKPDPHDSGRSASIKPLLLQQLERLRDTRTLAVGAVRNLANLDPGLRGDGLFDCAIDLPVPDSRARADILKVIADLSPNKGHSVLNSIAARTHGYVGADLRRLVKKALFDYYKRIDNSFKQRGEMNVYEAMEPEVIFAELHSDLNNALSHVHPTAMQEIFVEIPNVKWDDIGGQQEVKQVLEEALEWPIKYSERMVGHRVRPQKGLLLYGPPGCSKTMIAKAAATESGLNFIGVKGSELMSMYVGESERALRELFSKAQAVKPSIIFFDEIDAIGATSVGGQHGGVQTATTLLTEMDGMGVMEGVFVLAATNKPEILDPALLRAGRLDTTAYVGLPDIEARDDILRMQMDTMRLGQDLDRNTLSKQTDGFSGAEIVRLCDKARYAALREEIKSQEDRCITQNHFYDALSKAEKSVTQTMTKRYKAWGASRH